MGVRRTSPAFRLLALAGALLACSLLLGACGSSSDQKSVKEGQAAELGGLRYNTVFSRYLNANDPEDAAYLVGQPKAKPGELYLGVFLQVKNIGNKTSTLPSVFTVTDTEGELYTSLPSTSEFAFPTGTKLEDDRIVPDPDSPAGSGPIQGSLVLFRVPDSANENRPLTLMIPGPGGPAEVELDI